MSLTITEKAASEVKRIIDEQKHDGDAPEKLYLRLRIIGGGCSGLQKKLDLDTSVNPKLDETFDFHGVPVVVDKRSLMYLSEATLEFHNEINKRGFSIEIPNVRSTCGCGSSFSM